MFIVDEKTGDIITRQGDSGTLVLNNIDTSRNWKVYFSVYDKNRKQMINEIFTQSNNLPTVAISISANATDPLKVNSDEEYATYYYGVKLCADGIEDTLIIGNGDIDSENTITVYPKKTEGDT